MPNNNASGVNQPLDKTPAWMVAHRVIGADAAIFADVDPAVDLLVIAPPSVGGVRLVSGTDNGLPSVRVDNASGVLLTAPELIYKDAAGNEVILETAANIADGADGPVSPDLAFPLIPTDQGIFLRLTGGAATGVSVTSNWQDVDNVAVFDAALAGASKVSLFPAATPGEALMLLDVLPSTILTAWALNKDDVNHDGANVTMTQEEGSVSVPFRHGGWGVLAAGDATGIFDDSKPVATPEIVVNISDATAVNAIAPVVRIAYTRLNQGPVAQEQASAF